MEQVNYFINYGFFLFSLIVLTSYIVLGIISIFEIRSYRRKNVFIDYNEILIADDTPLISVIAPAYNEETTIVENIKSLLSLHYPNFQVIVVNDGSKDNTLTKIIKEYDLKKVNYYFENQVPTKNIRSVYKSTNPAYHTLLVIDKENGGKADALNVGLNVSLSDLVACIDVDCILAEDSLLKMVKPFLEKNERKVIASGGIIKIVNSCEIKKGKLIKLKIPNKFFPRVQLLEYIRAFLMGRMAWSRLDGLLLISGAFGLFDRRIAIACGGYNHKTVGEDMELVVRMRRYMIENKQKYRVYFIPDPLCWTEVPDTRKALSTQRNRWTRGTIETLWIHRIMFFNPKYGVLGLMSYPYWLFLEWLAPIIEFFGLIYFFYLYFFEGIYWLFFFSLLAAIYLFAVMYTTFSLLIEELTYNEYERKRDMLILVFTALLEPFFFHPFVIWAAIKGNFNKLTGKKVGWGNMDRNGFEINK